MPSHSRDPAPTNGDPARLSVSVASRTASIFDTGCGRTGKQHSARMGIGPGWALSLTTSVAPPLAALHTTACHSFVSAADALSWKRLSASAVIACASRNCEHTNSQPSMSRMLSVARLPSCPRSSASSRFCSRSARMRYRADDGSLRGQSSGKVQPGVSHGSPWTRPSTEAITSDGTFVGNCSLLPRRFATSSSNVCSSSLL